MHRKNFPSPWKASKIGDKWVISGLGNEVVAKLEGKANNEKSANLIAASPYMLGSLKAILRLIGSEDLPDNGEWSGAAITDQVRAAIASASGLSD